MVTFKKEELNSRIIESAIDELLSRGFDSATMEAIAKLAQVSKRTLYKYYPSKEDIFDTIIEKLLESICNLLPSDFDRSKDFEKQLEDVIDRKIELFTKDEYLKISKLVLSELLRSKKLKESHLKRFNDSENKFITWINEAKKNGDITCSLPSENIANQFHSIIKGQIFYPVIFGIKQVGPKDLNVIRNITKEFFLNSFTRS